jgi:Tat protein secretion system quality control protein TatD with DNase activity
MICNKFLTGTLSLFQNRGHKQVILVEENNVLFETDMPSCHYDSNKPMSPYTMAEFWDIAWPPKKNIIL